MWVVPGQPANTITCLDVEKLAAEMPPYCYDVTFADVDPAEGIGIPLVGGRPRRDPPPPSRYTPINNLFGEACFLCDAAPCVCGRGNR